MKQLFPKTGCLALKPVAVLYANPKGNIGDFAILDAMLRDIANRYAGRRIHVYWHGFLIVDKARLAAFQAEDGTPDFTVVGGTFHRPVSRWLKRVYRMKVWPLVQRTLINRLLHDSLPEAKKFAEYEAVFLAGGDQWNGMDLGVSMFATLMAVAHYNSEIYQYPFSLNPMARNFNTDSDLRRYFKKIRSPIIVRDGITHDVMTQVGIPTTLGRDTVFSLSEIGRKIAPLGDRDPRRILLVLTGPHNRDLLRKSLSDLLERQQGCGRPIELLTTCWTEDLKVYTELGERFGVKVRAPMTWQEAIAELKQSAVVVTDRLHCLILGTFAECTLFPVGDRKKAEAFVRDSGTPHHVSDMMDITPARLEAAIADRNEILAALRAYRDSAGAQSSAPCLLCSQLPTSC